MQGTDRGKGKMRIFRQPVRWIVIHPEKGSAVVLAYSQVDARMMAAMELGLTAQEQSECRLGIHKEDLDKEVQNDHTG